MKKEARSGEKRRSGIDIRFYMMGEDVVFLVTGGTPHIGAAATAYVTDSQIIRTEVIALPGHREGPLVCELAETAARKLGRTVAVLAGIHLDRPSQRDIEQIVEQAKLTMRMILEQWPHNR